MGCMWRSHRAAVSWCRSLCVVCLLWFRAWICRHGQLHWNNTHGYIFRHFTTALDCFSTGMSSVLMWESEHRNTQEFIFSVMFTLYFWKHKNSRIDGHTADIQTAVQSVFPYTTCQLTQRCCVYLWLSRSTNKQQHSNTHSSVTHGRDEPSDWPITDETSRLTDQSQTRRAVWLTNHRRDEPSDWPITDETSRLTDQSQTRRAVWLTNHRRDEPSDWPITDETSRLTDQSRTRRAVWLTNHGRDEPSDWPITDEGV